MPDVVVRFDELLQLRDRANTIVADLEGSHDHASALADAVAKPFGENGVYRKAWAVSFGWGCRRSQLIRDLESLVETIEEIVARFQRLDQDAATEFEAEQVKG